MSNKGLSGIVTIVLIVLLVVGAVSAIWVFIQPTLRDAGISVGGAQICLDNKVEPVSCVRVTASGKPAYNIAFKSTISNESVQMLNKTVITLKYKDGSAKTISRVESLGSGVSAGESANLIVNSNGSEISKVSISGEFILYGGAIKICVSSDINCVTPSVPIVIPNATTSGGGGSPGSGAGVGEGGGVHNPETVVYPSNWCNGADINKDGKVDGGDLAFLSDPTHWYNSCDASNNWCNGADIDKSGFADLGDLAILGDETGNVCCPHFC
ncbi:MAG: hypothetical protein AABX66_00955 [Nanoarchaeota archaeon]